jgi:branched-chain amino acid transport system permease protein
MQQGNSRLVQTAFTRHTFSWLDLLPCLVAVLTWFLAEDYLPLATQVVIMMIFALSLDLILGYGGIETLGQAALFGAGSYAAGLFALHVSPEPLSGLAVAAAAGAATALASGPIVLRCRGITLVMLTLAVSSVMLELANAWRSVTGGADGLHGYQVAPLLGIFDFDLWGHTAYWYSVCVLAVVFVVCKVLVHSPFGLVIRGISDNSLRMRLLGLSVTRHLLILYIISGAIAGLAGGLSAQVTQLVSVDAFSFVLSGNVLIMLILGGTGSLYGAMLGAAVFVVVSDRAAEINPFNWLFALGIVLILAVRYAPDGLVTLLARWPRLRRGA